MIHSASKIFICALIAMLTACTHVAPWERGHLAKPQMATEPYPAQRALMEHVYSSREAGAVGSAGQGGGCGCY